MRNWIEFGVLLRPEIRKYQLCVDICLLVLDGPKVVLNLIQLLIFKNLFRLLFCLNPAHSVTFTAQVSGFAFDELLFWTFLLFLCSFLGTSAGGKTEHPRGATHLPSRFLRGTRLATRENLHFAFVSHQKWVLNAGRRTAVYKGLGSDRTQRVWKNWGKVSH